MNTPKPAAVTAAKPVTQPGPDIPLVAYPGLSGKRLSALAALMTRKEGEPAGVMVQRAIQVWNEAHKAIEPEKYADWEMSCLPDEIPFSIVASRGLLPHLNGHSTVTSSKGVKNIFDAYLNGIATDMPAFSNHFQLEPHVQKDWVTRIKSRCDALGMTGQIPKAVLPYLRQFQARRKDGGKQITLEEVRVFGAVPEGLRRAWAG